MPGRQTKRPRDRSPLVIGHPIANCEFVSPLGLGKSSHYNPKIVLRSGCSALRSETSFTELGSLNAFSQAISLPQEQGRANGVI
jgi:hypothetical protein